METPVRAKAESQTTKLVGVGVGWMGGGDSDGWSDGKGAISDN